MAFELPEPDVRHMRPSRGIADTSTADALNSLSGIVGALGDHAAAKRAAKDDLEDSAAVGSATQGLLELQNERIASIDSARTLTQQVRRLTEDDGEFSQEDMASLNMTEKQLQRLKSGRLVGMSASEFAARKNSLHSQQLAANPHLTQEINSLFNSGLASAAKIKPEGELLLEKDLDNKYGVGGWTAVDKAFEISKGLHLENMRLKGEASIASLDGQVANISVAIGDGPLQALMTSITDNGGLNDSAVGAYQQAVLGAFAGAQDQLNTNIAAARSRGEKLDQEQVNRLRNELEQARTFYTDTVFNTSLQGQDLKTQIEKAMEIRRLMFEANLPVAAGEMLTGSMGGVGGSGMQNYLLEIVKMPPSGLQALFPDAPSSEIKRMQDLARTVAFSYVNSEDVTFLDLAEKGLITPAMATLLSTSAIKQSTKEPDQFVRAVASYRSSLMLDDNGDFTESIRNFGTLATQAATAARGNNPAVKQEVQQLLRSYLARVTNSLKSEDLVVRPGFSVQIDPSARQTGMAPGAASAVQQRAQQKALNALIDTYQLYSAQGLADIKDLDSLMPKEKLTPTNEVTAEGRPVYVNQKGQGVSERTITVEIDGGAYNIPTVYDGEFVSQEEAVQKVMDAGMKDPVTGKDLPRYNSVEQAVDAAAKRSDELGEDRTRKLPDYLGGTGSMLKQVKDAVARGIIKPSDHQDVIKATRNDPQVIAYLAEVSEGRA